MALRLALAPLLIILFAYGADDFPGRSRKAKEALLAKRYAEATELYRDLVRDLPADPGLRLNLGMALYSSGHYSEAVRELRIAVSKNASLQPAWVILGMAYSKLDRPADAVAPLQRALDLQPDSVLVHLELGDALLATGQAAPAAKQFNAAVSAEPRNARALLGLALSYMALPGGGGTEAARRAVDQLSQLPASAESHELLAETYAAKNRRSDAIEEWRAALALSPRDARLRARLAEALRDNRDYEEANKILTNLVKDGASPRTEFLMGDVLFRQGKSEEALSHLRKAIAAAPALLSAHAVLGRIYLQLEKPAEAAPHLELALPTDKDGSLYHQLGIAYRQLGQSGKAQEAFAREQSIRTRNGL